MEIEKHPICCAEHLGRKSEEAVGTCQITNMQSAAMNWKKKEIAMFSTSELSEMNNRRMTHNEEGEMPFHFILVDVCLKNTASQHLQRNQMYRCFLPLT